MAKLEESGRARGSLARGFRRVFIVLAGLYWLTGAFATFETYQGAYQGEVALAGAEKERSEAAADAADAADATAAADAAAAAATAASQAADGIAGPWNDYKAPPPAAEPSTPPAEVASHVAALREQYRGGSMSPDKAARYEEATRRGIVTDPYALDRIARSAGWNAAGWTLIGWMIGFAVLTAIALVIRWIWRGFVGKPTVPQ